MMTVEINQNYTAPEGVVRGNLLDSYQLNIAPGGGSYERV